MDSKWILLYFYYGGLLFAVLGQYREAFAMMQKACCVPAIAPSAIVLRAYKVVFLHYHCQVTRGIQFYLNFCAPNVTSSLYRCNF